MTAAAVVDGRATAVVDGGAGDGGAAVLDGRSAGTNEWRRRRRRALLDEDEGTVQIQDACAFI